METTLAFIFAGALIVIVITIWIVSRQKRDEAWQQLAYEIGAEFISGGLFHASKVQTQVKDSTVVLDTYTVPSGDSSTTYTRVKATLQNKDGLQFKIFRTGLISKIGKALGMQDIEIGDADFDHDFTIQGNNELKVRALFTNQRIKQLIQTQKSIHLSLKNNELHFEVQGVIRDVERLKSLFELFREVLGQLAS